MEKEYDLFANILKNPDFSYNDFIAAGLTADNTLLESKEHYKKSDKVKQAFSDITGKFDNDKFDKVYNIATTLYNSLADASYDKAIAEKTIYHRDNIFAPINQRRKGPEFIETVTPNPFQTSTSIIELGKEGDRTKSIDELAQANKVLLNPNTAGDNLEKAQWGDTPNDSFFKYFADTLVLAQYDEDGQHKDLMTGKIVNHAKGDLKTDADGNFYYEKLDGRNIYNRRVLNKMNVLTTDGSFWNKYDFFDSDDLNEKGILPTTLKNLALVGSMFIPYVGPWITGLSIATQTTGMLTTLGKMALGSDNATLSEVEGFVKSLDRQSARSEYAQNNTWCWENFINLIGDVVGQLKEQRFIFEKIPGLTAGATSKAGWEAKKAKLLNEHKLIAEKKIKDLKLNDLAQWTKQANEIRTAEAMLAEAELAKALDSSWKLGSMLSKAYMTGITVKDTYGEAKNAGASDLDATLLTLGYAAGEYALLSTGIGEWIMPELRAGRYKMQAIKNALLKLEDEAAQSAWKQGREQLAKLSLKEGKKDYVKKLFNIGKNIARAEYSNGTKTLRATAASALGEATEETTEEILADFSKGCYDVVKWLQGDDTRLNSFGYDFKTGTWNQKEVIDRYGMSFVGGLFGGGITNVVTNYNMINNINGMTSQQAIQELVYMARNKKLDEFKRYIQKTPIADKNKSTEIHDIGGSLVFGEGTKNNNQDLIAKQAIFKQLDLIQSILDANGASLPDDSFLSTVLPDLRYAALYKSTTAGRFLQEFNSLNAELVDNINQINTIVNTAKDTNNSGAVEDFEARKNKLSNEDQQKVKDLEKKQKEIQNKIKDLLEGKRTTEFVSDALFEMTPMLSDIFKVPNFIMYAEQQTGKKASDLNDSEKERLYKEYTNWKTTDGRDQIHILSDIYKSIAQQSSKVIQEQAENYNKIAPEVEALNRIINIAHTPTSNDISELQEILDYYLGTRDKIGFVGTVIDEDVTLDTLSKNLPAIVEKILEPGFINRETKNHLLSIVNKSLDWVNGQYNEASSMEDFDTADILFPISQSLIKAKKDIENANESPLEENLNQFAISLGKDGISLTQLIDKVNSIFRDNSEDISTFNLEEETYKELNNTIELLEMYKASILGARTDSAGLNDYYGYNATLNEVSSKYGESLNLAEIDSHTADLFVSDIDVNLNKLRFLKQLYNLNKNQKLTRQDRVATKRDTLIYKGLKNLVNNPGDLSNWKGFNTFKEAVEGSALHQEVLDNWKVLNKQQLEEFAKEQLNIEDSIYEFFQNNKDKLSNIDKLKKFINPNIFSLYNINEEILNEDLESLSDNTLLWWLASRAAVKSSDFYKEFADIIDPTSDDPIAPIATQEAAVYNTYASILNGDIFSNFLQAYKQSMLEDWKNLSMDRRKEILKDLGLDESMATQDASGFLPIPRYSNITLVDGIPGSGKTTGVSLMLKQMLAKYHPELLSDVIFTHGTNLDSAQKWADNLGIKDAKVFNREKLMKYIDPNWTEYEFNDTTGIYSAKDKDFIFIPGEGVRSARPTIQTSKPPSLIFLDEVSHFNAYDLDQINDFAQKHGITVIVSGDYDQSGMQVYHKLSEDLSFIGDSQRKDFIRTPKLGISMRTDNSIKSVNLQKAQLFLHDQKSPLQLEYYEYERGLFGDKVITVDNEAQIVDDDDFQQRKKAILNELKIEVDKLIKTLEEGQKIGYIFNSKKSPIYEMLSQDEYKDYIDFKFGNTAQGQEGRYYIVDVDPYRNGSYRTIDYLKDVYTGISRAEQGSILIGYHSNRDYAMYSKQVYNKVDEPLGKQIIQKYAKARKNLLSKILSNTKKTEYIPRTVTKKETLKPTSDDVVSPPSNDQPSGNQGQDSDQNNPNNNQSSNDQGESNNDGNNSPNAQPQNNPPQDSNQSPSSQQGNQSTNNNQPNNQLPEDSNSPSQQDDQSSNASEDNPPNDNQQDNTEPPVNNQSDNLPSLGPKWWQPTVADIDPTADGRIPTTEDEENNFSSTTESLPSPETEIQPSYYDEEDTPILTNGGIQSEESYKEDLDTYTEEVSDEPEESVEEVDEGVVKILHMLYSFNTFETGITSTDESGFPLFTSQEEQEKAAIRIDSVHGLMKIPKLKGKKLQEYIKELGYLRNIIFNNSDKAKICEKVQKRLGIDNLYCTFALKNTATVSKKNRENGQEFVSGTNTQFDKGASEKILFNNSDDIKSKDWTVQNIVAIFGNKESGDILELPLLSITNPYTILNNTKGREVFKEMYNRKQQLEKTLTVPEMTRVLISEFANIPKYKELVNMLRMFALADNAIFYIKDNNWTPVKDLTWVGPQFVTHKGDYLQVDGLFYDYDDEEGWQSIAQFSENPQIKVTRIMTSISDEIDGVQERVVHKGHPFVLVSYDRSLESEQDIIDYFIRQYSEGAPKKVQLVYVLPPKASIRDYLQNLHNILNKVPQTQNIGTLFTAYKLWQYLIQDKGFFDFIEAKSFGLGRRIKDTIEELDNMSSNQERVNALNTPRDWTDIGIGLTNHNVKLIGLLEGALNLMYSKRRAINLDSDRSLPGIDTDVVQTIESILELQGVDGIYYRSKIPKSDKAERIGPFVVTEQDNNWILNGLSYSIHGKVDSNMFKGDLSTFLQSCLDSLKYQASGLHQYSIDNTSYLKGRSNIFESVEDQTNQELDNLYNKVFQDTGIRVERKDTIEEANLAIRNELSRNGFPCLLVNGKVLYSKQKIQGISTLYIGKGDIQSVVDNGGIAEIPIEGIYEDSAFTTFGSYNVQNNTLEFEKPNLDEQFQLHINEDNFTEYIAQAKEILADIISYDANVNDLYNSSDITKFLDAIENQFNPDENRIEDLEALEVDESQRYIIDDLIAINNRAAKKLSEDSCPITIKIQF